MKQEFREQFGDVGPKMADAMLGRLHQYDERTAVDFAVDAACNSVAAREMMGGGGGRG